MEILSLWRAQGHKALVFAQGRRTLDLIEAALAAGGRGGGEPPPSYQRMDGTTPVGDRQVLVDRFNEDPSLGLFLPHRPCCFCYLCFP